MFTTELKCMETTMQEVGWIDEYILRSLGKISLVTKEKKKNIHTYIVHLLLTYIKHSTKVP